MNLILEILFFIYNYISIVLKNTYHFQVERSASPDRSAACNSSLSKNSHNTCNSSATSASCSTSTSSSSNTSAKSLKRQGAIIESMHHHGKGVYSGTFSGKVLTNF